MKTFLSPAASRTLLGCALGVSLSNLSASADDPDPAWQVRFSGNALFNVSASFKGHLSVPSTAPMPSVINYDNGYVGRDISGDPALSTYWGYNNSSQRVISGPNVTGLNFQAITPVLGQSAPRMDADASPGGELTLRRRLGRYRSLAYGLELGGGFNQITLKDSADYSAPGVQTTASYAMAAPINSGLIPIPGYRGPYDGFGAIINPTPLSSHSSTVPGLVQVSDSRAMDADIFGFRFGPYLELPLAKNLAISLSAGAALAFVHDHLDWTETLAVNGQTTSASVSGDSVGMTAGFYAGADLEYRLEKNWLIFGGAKMQNAGTYSHHIGTGQMDLDLGQAFSLQAGMGYSF